MLRGISAGKYDEGKMSRGNIYVAFFCYCYCYFSSVALLCYNQSRHRPFQRVNNNEGLFFPLKRRKPSKVENKKTRLTHICALQHLITCSLFFLLCFVVFFLISFFSNGQMGWLESSQIANSSPLNYAVNRLITEGQELQWVWFRVVTET